MAKAKTTKRNVSDCGSVEEGERVGEGEREADKINTRSENPIK